MDHSMHNMDMSDHVNHNHSESTPKEYAKLAGVILFIVIVSWFAQQYFLNSLSWMQIFMGVFFLVFSIFKLANLKGFVDAYIGYDIIAQRSTAYAYAYPFIEAALGLGSLLNIPGTNYLVIFFMVIGSIGVTKQLLRKSNFQCACLGTFIKLPLTTVSLTEDLVMLVMAIILLLQLIK